MYSWRPSDVLSLLGIPFPSNRNEVKIPCPFCSRKNFGFNLSRGVGKCYQCDKGADSASYYAAVMGMTLYDARKDIERRLGINDEFQNVARYTPRIVCVPEETYDSPKPPDDVLDDTYRAFLNELTLSEKNRKMLINRGLSNSAIDSLLYRSFPDDEKVDIFGLCKKLQGIDPVTKKVDPQNAHILKGVPGFFKAKRGKGDYTIVKLTKGIIMPQVNVHNQICSLQIRKDDDERRFIEEEERFEEKCAWFSSKGRYDGCTSGSNIHFACDFKYNKEKGRYDPIIPEKDGVKGVMLTEGIMKADIAHFCLPNCPVISVQGVNSINQLATVLKYLIAEYGLNTVALAYDMDYQTNPNVQKALEKTKALITGLNLTFIPRTWPANVKVCENNIEKEVNLNGIDDFLVFTRFGIYPQVKKI